MKSYAYSKFLDRFFVFDKLADRDRAVAEDGLREASRDEIGEGTAKRLRQSPDGVYDAKAQLLLKRAQSYVAKAGEIEETVLGLRDSFVVPASNPAAFNDRFAQLLALTTGSPPTVGVKHGQPSSRPFA